jgi:hypothetical protein
MTDFTIKGQAGDSVFLVVPGNDVAAKHLVENTGPEAQYLGNALAVEHRYIEHLVHQLAGEGWEIQLPSGTYIN